MVHEKLKQATLQLEDYDTKLDQVTETDAPQGAAVSVYHMLLSDVL